LALNIFLVSVFELQKYLRLAISLDEIFGISHLTLFRNIDWLGSEIFGNVEKLSIFFAKRKKDNKRKINLKVVKPENKRRYSENVEFANGFCSDSSYRYFSTVYNGLIRLKSLIWFRLNFFFQFCGFMR